MADPALFRAKTGRRRAGSAPDDLWQSRLIALVGTGIGRLTDSSLTQARRIRKGRQTTKAVQSLLRLAPGRLTRKADGIALALSGVRRTLAAARDSDALVEACRCLCQDLDLPKRDVLGIERVLSADSPHDDRRRDDDIGRAVALFQRVARQITTWETGEGGRKRLANGVAADYRKLRRDMRAAFAAGDIEALHRLRKAVIRHRHQIAFLATVAPRSGMQKALVSRAGQTKALGEFLGHHRDLQLLDAALRQRHMPTRLRASVTKVLKASARLQDHDLAEARSLTDKLTKRSGKAMALSLRQALKR